jgi:hypothetical protein
VLQKGGAAGRLVVGEDLDKGNPGGIVDGDINVVVAALGQAIFVAGLAGPPEQPPAISEVTKTRPPSWIWERPFISTNIVAPSSVSSTPRRVGVLTLSARFSAMLVRRNLPLIRSPCQVPSMFP